MEAPGAVPSKSMHQSSYLEIRNSHLLLIRVLRME